VRSGAFIFAGVLSLPFLFNTADASEQDYTCRQLKGVRTSTPPVIDGDIGDPVWQTAAVADTFIDQTTGQAPADQTIARILYDDKAIYVAFECKDSQPNSITARETVRDSKYQQTNGPGDTEDNVEVRLDMFFSHKKEDISYFSVNALGTTSAQLAGGRANKAEWQGDFKAAVRRTSTGWTAEMQIPWSGLNFPASRAPAIIGINFTRFQVRTQIKSMWSNTGPNNYLDKEGMCSGMLMPRSGFHPKLSVLPYTLAEVEPDGRSLRGGLDARYTVTPELTAVGSLKPDFSTVEGAVSSIQFSLVEQSVPERRPFFLEGNQYFNVQTQYNDIGRLFYSNRIQSFDLGTKVYGKISPADTLGYFDAYDFNGRNDLITRYNHSFGANVSGGFLVGERNDSSLHNDLLAGDFHGRWGKVGFETIEATTKGTGAGGGANVYNLYYTDKTVIAAFQYHDVSNNFFVPDGYVPYFGYKGPMVTLAHFNQWRHGPFRAFQIFTVPNYWMHMNGKPYIRAWETQGWIDTRSDLHLAFDYNYQLTDNQMDNTVTLTAINGVSNRFLQYGLTGQFGILANQPASFLAPQVSFRVFKKLDVSYGGAILNFQGVTQQHILTANYELSPTRSFGGRMVTRNSDTNAYLFYHNSGGKGTEMYVLLGDPNTLKFQKKLSVKMVFALG